MSKKARVNPSENVVSLEAIATLGEILQNRDLSRVLPIHMEHQQLYERHQVTVSTNLRELDTISHALVTLLNLMQIFGVTNASRHYVWQVWQKISKIELNEIKDIIKTLEMRREE